MKQLFLRISAICSPLVAAALLVLPAHAAPFAVYGPTPTQAYIHVATEYTANFESGAATIERCELFVDGSSQGAMTLSGTSLIGTAKKTVAIHTAGSHTVRATCYDDDGPSYVDSEATVNVIADSTGPTVSPFVLSPISPVAGAALNLQTNYDDAAGSGINTCGLIVDGAEAGLLSLSGGVGSATGTATFNGTISGSGSHTLTINCFDRSSNLGTRSQVVVFASSADSVPPVVAMIDQSSVALNTSLQHTATVSDNVGIVSCNLFVDGADKGSMSVAGGVASKNFTYTSGGSHSAYARCSDAAGNLTSGSARTITVVDATAPVIGTISPSTATVGSSVNISATYTSSAGVGNCHLYVNGSDAGTMELSGSVSGYAQTSFNFSSTGNQTAEVRCTDLLGHIGSASRTITVNASAGAYARQLIKLACPSGTLDVNHPCKAVYYVGSDNRRHAFPNSKVYFTWYSDFSGVIEVSNSVMASFILGSNVTYRPGVRMVKFTTVDRVYAVTRTGVLRWVKTEAAANAIYGSDWNHRVDDISDAFYGNYSFGADINAASDYNASAETSAVSSIDNNF